MSQIILLTVVTLVAIGAAAAIILYFVAQKFKVFEDPRIDQVEEALPAANCGGCGFAGCRNFAETLVKKDDWDDCSARWGEMRPWQKLLPSWERKPLSRPPGWQL